MCIFAIVMTTIARTDKTVYAAPGLREILVSPQRICLTSFTGDNLHQGYEDDGDIEY